jgi:hypothetical protein
MARNRKFVVQGDELDNEKKVRDGGVACTWHLRTQAVVAGGSWVQGQPGLHREW